VNDCKIGRNSKGGTDLSIREERRSDVARLGKPGHGGHARFPWFTVRDATQARLTLVQSLTPQEAGRRRKVSAC
jgi:hypothetical protein